MKKKKRERVDQAEPSLGRPTILTDVDKAGLKRWADDLALRGRGQTLKQIFEKIHAIQRLDALKSGFNETSAKLACQSAMYKLLSKLDSFTAE